MLRAGFTLVELAIVLVIIGLLVGGVLVGREMIRAAELRSEISMINKYQLAIFTFRLKYNALPGDMPNAVARIGAATNGDGDGMIGKNNCSNWGEGEYIWNHLSTAGLIEGSFSGNYTNPCTPAACPASKLYPNNLLWLQDINCFFSFSGTGLYGLPRTQPHMSYALAWANGNYTAGWNVADAMAMDTKLDDGDADRGLWLTANDGAVGGGCVTGGYAAATPDPGSTNYNPNSTAGCLPFYILR